MKMDSADQRQIATAIPDKGPLGVLPKGLGQLKNMGVRLAKLKSDAGPADVPNDPPETVETGPALVETEEKTKTDEQKQKESQDQVTATV